MEAGPCRRPYSVQARSPTTRTAHHKNQQKHGSQCGLEALLCEEGKPATEGRSTILSRLSCLFTENTARANTHPRDMGTHRIVGVDAHTMDDRVGGISQKSQGSRTHFLFSRETSPYGKYKCGEPYLREALDEKQARTSRPVLP